MFLDGFCGAGSPRALYSRSWGHRPVTHRAGVRWPDQALWPPHSVVPTRPSCRGAGLSVAHLKDPVQESQPRGSQEVTRPHRLRITSWDVYFPLSLEATPLGLEISRTLWDPILIIRVLGSGRARFPATCSVLWASELRPGDWFSVTERVVTHWELQPLLWPKDKGHSLASTSPGRLGTLPHHGEMLSHHHFRPAWEREQ